MDRRKFMLLQLCLNKWSYRFIFERPAAAIFSLVANTPPRLWPPICLPNDFMPHISILSVCPFNIEWRNGDVTTRAWICRFYSLPLCEKKKWNKYWKKYKKKQIYIAKRNVLRDKIHSYCEKKTEVLYKLLFLFVL